MTDTEDRSRPTPASTDSPAERERALRAEIAALRAELELREAALVALGERLIPVEHARAEGAAGERERREAAETELRALKATRLYRMLLRPRALLYRRRAGG
ncbi:MAG TPA: hypothetical protein VFZ83_00335 [Acidimicrobiia bacterium]|nr:hypothetical protein [Acidimicrobiia bacterium]